MEGYEIGVGSSAERIRFGGAEEVVGRSPRIIAGGAAAMVAGTWKHGVVVRSLGGLTKSSGELPNRPKPNPNDREDRLAVAAEMSIGMEAGGGVNPPPTLDGGSIFIIIVVADDAVDAEDCRPLIFCNAAGGLEPWTR